jgi:hypothetical protein
LNKAVEIFEEKRVLNGLDKMTFTRETNSAVAAYT